MSTRSAHKGGVGRGASAAWSAVDEQAYVDALRLIDRRAADMNAMLRERRKRFENVLGYSPVSKLHSPRARRMHVASPATMRPSLPDTPNGLHVLDAIHEASLQRAGGHVERRGSAMPLPTRGATTGRRASAELRHGVGGGMEHAPGATELRRAFGASDGL